MVRPGVGETRYRLGGQGHRIVARLASEVAYTPSLDALSVTPHDSKEASQLAGHRLTVYRKQPDGRWLLARDAHTLSPVAC